MPYRITVSPLDLGSCLGGSAPTLAGSIFSPPPSTPTPPGGSTTVPVDTATSTPADPWTLTFPSLPATGPSGPSAVLIKVGAGDMFRSGPLNALPDTSASPAPFVFYTPLPPPTTI